jgi:mono/diheme cytochrome c family protein
MSAMNSAQLVERLSHPNGWWRDTAQRLLVERADRSATGLLVDLALQGADPLGRIHGLWTLEGLGVNHETAERLARVLEDPETRVRVAGIRVLERLIAARHESSTRLLMRLERRLESASPEERLQIVLTAGSLAGKDRLRLLAKMASTDAESPLMRDAVISGVGGDEIALLNLLWADQTWELLTPGRQIFIESLTGAAVGAGSAVELLNKIDPGDSGFDWRQRAVASGMAIRATGGRGRRVRLKRKPDALVSFNSNGSEEDRRLLDQALSLFDWPGRPQQTLEDSSRPLSPSERQMFTEGRRQYLAICAACHGVDGKGLMPLGPPLVNSEWVLGSEERLARIVLQGLEGPITVAGTRYESPLILPNMPAVPMVNDQDVAAVLTYVRRGWGHGAEPVQVATISRIKAQSAGRVTPWTEQELLSIE